MSLRLWHDESGQWRSVRADFVPVIGPDDAVVEVVAAFADLTGRQAAEGQLAGLGRLLDSFLTGSPVGFALVDPGLRFEVVNETMARADGWAVEAHVGRRVDEVPSELGRMMAPSLRRVLDTGMPVLGLELTAGRGPDGTAPRDWLVNYFPVRWADGSLRGVGATVVDITERNRSEAMMRDLQARQAQDRFRAALDVMRDSVAIDSAIRDASGSIVDFRLEYLNPVVADISGRRRDELIGTTMLESWPEMAGTDLFKAYVRTVETGEPFIDNQVRYEALVRGERVAALFAVQALRFGDGLLVCSRNITDDHEADLRLREAEVELGVEHRIVERLQQALLPPELPRSSQFEIGACYFPVDARAELGGDWYDAFVLPDGMLGLSIGDVTGHGLDAAALMAQVRLALRAYAFDPVRGGDPAAVVQQLDRLLGSAPPVGMATAVYAIYDPDSGRLRWSRAGHPLPILCPPGGSAAPLPTPGGPPLGSGLAEAYPVCERVLEPGAVVLLYTDGLVERRERPIQEGIDEVCERLQSPHLDDLSARCEAIAEAARGGLPTEDDVCILALRRSAPGP
jgi:PAS domain S-box-containing protein